MFTFTSTCEHSPSLRKEGGSLAPVDIVHGSDCRHLADANRGANRRMESVSQDVEAA